MTVGSQIAIAAGSDAALSAGSQYALTGTVDPEQVVFDGIIGAATAGMTATTPWADHLEPHSVRFSQSSVNDVQEIIDSMRAHGWRGRPVDVVTMRDGELTSIDNSRLLAARYSDTRLRARIHAFEDQMSTRRAPQLRSRAGVIPSTWGDAAEYRIQRQNAAFRRLYPSGSPFVGWRGD
ncbi:MAG: hypothetical protein JO291_07680 [Acidimicrobiia bacterium]|nr:hypothetical protein [Acidimicrobiia bacterium]